MNFLGIVPKVAKVSFLYIAFSALLERLFTFDFSFPRIGGILVFVGIVLWAICYFQVSKAYKAGKLLKSGCYSVVRHPIYTIWGVLILPGFSLVIGGFMLGLPVVYWISILYYIEEEERFLHVRFGKEWEEYASRVPRFIPNLFEVIKKLDPGERK
ncbi:methyltransferase family protein [Pyrococcus horikoshii]|uniref:Isoprenylcysteine carboxylmethyltransferase family protein n=1 Tax=Pyrococcus horikoshii TaxID=53953 RepID=A0A832SLI6_PYRHR|nr:isoprenylcysteine carboxylmethyltransferase family protein [Pyrococcus horikoshii]HII60237.1 isoprenylcysteine carboxylmethyltransferase family protein [Pyrococcus horikoshii]